MKRPISIVAMFFVLGSILFQFRAEESDPETDKFDLKEPVCFQGILIDKDQSENNLIFTLWDPVSETGILCYLDKNNFSDLYPIRSIITVRGSIKEMESSGNPGVFDQKNYYEKKGIDYLLFCDSIEGVKRRDSVKEFFYDMKWYLGESIENQYPEREAAFLNAVLLGEKSGLSTDLTKLYQRNGFSHLLAISGLHISFLGMGLYRMLRGFRLPPWCMFVLLSGCMLFYGAVIGFPVSSVRAISMFLIFLAARTFRYCYDTFSSLSAAAILSLIVSSGKVFEAGFLFSFLAVLGILISSKISLINSEHKLTGNKLSRKKFGGNKLSTNKFLKALGTSVSVSLFTMPVQIYFFYQVPILSCLTNLLLIPLFSFVFGISLILFFFYGIGYGFGLEMPNIIIDLHVSLLRGFEGLIRIFDDIPASFITTGHVPLAKILLYSLSVVGAYWLLYRSHKVKYKVMALLILLSGLFLVLFPLGNFGIKGRPVITMLDTGQGECILFQTEQGKGVLIDGGSSSVSDVGNYRILPVLKYYGIKELEAVFLTHSDEDHVNGIMEIVEMGRNAELKINKIFLPFGAKDVDQYKELAKYFKDHKITVYFMQENSSFETGGMEFYCLYDGSGALNNNDYSLVLEFHYLNFRGLFTGDISAEVEVLLCGKMQGSYHLYKAAHHGSNDSNSTGMLETTDPQIVLISCGSNNKYGHPGERVLEEIKEREIPCYLTMEQGAIMVYIREQSFFVIFYKR